MPSKLSLRPATVTLPELQEEIRKTEAIGFELTSMHLTIRENEELDALIYRIVPDAPPEITLHEFDVTDDEALQKTARETVERESRVLVAEDVLGVGGRERYVIASRRVAVATPVPPGPTPPAAPKNLFEKLAVAYAAATSILPQLKPVTLAQWALESGRGTSDLAIQHFNFAGLKWRPEMAGFATPTPYLAHDGLTDYCKFSSVEAFIKGYWQFLTRSPYRGWEAHTATGADFLRFIGPTYCPDAGYVNEVLDLVPEAENLLDRVTGFLGKFLPPLPPLPPIPIPLPIGGVRGTVVIDPGHGGTKEVGGSSPNNAVSFSGIKEKKIVLELAFLVRNALRALAPGVKVVLTRDNDENVGIKARARMAAEQRADLFLSIHLNGFNKKSRGTETWVRAASNGNVNLEADLEFAKKVQARMFAALKKHDPMIPDRGVKQDDDREVSLGVLNDHSLGGKARACLIEVEFIDVKSVDELLNTGPNAGQVRADLAAGLATAIIEELT